MLNTVIDVKLFAIHAGAFTERYNATLLAQNLEDTPENREAILNLHVERHHIFNELRATDVTDKPMLKQLSAELTALEYRLQEAWGFTQSEDFHSYWYHVPHCTCPKMDNADAMGSCMNYINSSCPVHGN